MAIRNRTQLIQHIKSRIKTNDWCDVSFSLLEYLYGTNDSTINPLVTKIAKTNKWKFHINESFRLVTFRVAGAKVGLGC